MILNIKIFYDEFIKKYETIHVCPWHQISKSELNNIYNELVNKMDIKDKYSFSYFINYIIKRLSGLEDAHTKYQNIDRMPYNYRLFKDEVIVNYPDDLKYYKLDSINDIDIKTIINELNNVITYGTEGKRVYEIEKSLFDRNLLFGLPCFNGCNLLDFKFIKDGNIINKSITKDEVFNNHFDYKKYLYGNTGEYKIINDILIYNHTSVQDEYKEIIENSIKRLESADLSKINKIIIDIRGNYGGNSAYNKLLMDFLKKYSDKKIICLTDYRVFSGGRYALIDLINLGAITIGEEISTPINCFGNSNWNNINNHSFSISECYFDPSKDIKVTSKEEYNRLITDEERKPYIYHPDILVNETKEDYLQGIDTILEYAIKYND